MRAKKAQPLNEDKILWANRGIRIFAPLAMAFLVTAFAY
jgi:hypothetical protein